MLEEGLFVIIIPYSVHSWYGIDTRWEISSNSCVLLENGNIWNLTTCG